MTLSIEPNRRYTVEEYLEIEGKHPQEKYEYREGIIVNMREALAMAGGSGDHCLINANVIRAIGNRLAGGPCRVYSNDLRIQIPRKALYTYPDAVVVCGQPQFESHATAGVTCVNPRVILEVLSPSTELYDRTRKFSLYRDIPTLVEYVLISQSDPRVETFFRHSDGGWSFGPSDGLEKIARLRSIEIDLPLSEVYEGITFVSEAQVQSP